MGIKNFAYLFILSLVGPVLKYNKDFQKIYQFLYLNKSLVNDYINIKSLTISYIFH